MSRLYPAIDLLNQEVVMLRKGAFGDKTVYPLSPVDYAETLCRAGISALHMVDLNGAETGDLKNGDLIAEVAQIPGLFLQVGGGIRDENRIEAYLKAGVDRVILGTVAVTDPAFLEAMVRHYGAHIAVGADCRQGRLVIRGWVDETTWTVEEFLDHLEAVGVETAIVTDVAKDGMLCGPNVSLYQRLRRRFYGELIASGGVSTVEDLRRLRQTKVDGVIVGSALLEGRMTLKEAQSAMEES